MARVGDELSGKFWRRFAYTLVFLIFCAHTVKGCAYMMDKPDGGFNYGNAGRRAVHNMNSARFDFGTSFERMARVCPKSWYSNCFDVVHAIRVIIGLG